MARERPHPVMLAAALAGVATLFVAVAQLWVAADQGRRGSDEALRGDAPEIGLSAAVGTWRTEVESPWGPQVWIQEFRENGTTSFRATGPGAPPDQEGTIRFTDGRWIARSPAIDYTDRGTYLMPDANTLVMWGEGGRAEWTRER